MKTAWLLFLLSTFSFAQTTTSFMGQSREPLKFQTIGGKLWCANSTVGFRILIEKLDLTRPDLDSSMIKTKSLLVRNMKSGVIVPYAFNPTDLLGSDESYVRTQDVEGFPKLFLKIFPHAATQHYVVDKYEVRLNHGAPVESSSGLVEVDFQYTEYEIGPQRYFGAAAQGNRLLLHCGNWDFEKNHAYDPNPFN